MYSLSYVRLRSVKRGWPPFLKSKFKPNLKARRPRMYIPQHVLNKFHGVELPYLERNLKKDRKGGAS